MGATDPCQFLSWDTDFFGQRIARVTGHRLTLQQVQGILAWCSVHAIECLYFLADSDDPETIRVAEDHGFRMVDLRVTLECDIRDRSPELGGSRLEAALRVRPARPADVPVLQKIAQESHWGTRFYSDPSFSTESCRALYATWVKRSCEGYADAVLVAELKDRPVGYISCHLPKADAQGHIGLFAVRREAHGRGVGQTLLDHALDWFTEHGAESVSVVTQGRNIAAQRLYQRCGFFTSCVQLWYHNWLTPCMAEVAG
jgi:dTDP-4-amino-4,6-dideoxy-D-galactose acyltransferase